MAMDKGVRETVAEMDQVKQELTVKATRVHALARAVYWAKESDVGLEAMGEEMEAATGREHEQAILNTVGPMIAQGVANGLLWAAIAEAAKE